MTKDLLHQVIIAIHKIADMKIISGIGRKPSLPFLKRELSAHV